MDQLSSAMPPTREIWEDYYKEKERATPPQAALNPCKTQIAIIIIIFFFFIMVFIFFYMFLFGVIF